MLGSLCAAKRQIKETVISSAAPAADSCVATGGGGGHTPTKCERGESDEGEERGEDRTIQRGSSP